MFKKIRQFFSIFFITSLILIGLIFVSIRNEEIYQKNCQILGATCDEGRVGLLVVEIKKYLNKTQEALSLWIKDIFAVKVELESHSASDFPK